jgi:hypothetical protein
MTIRREGPGARRSEDERLIIANAVVGRVTNRVCTIAAGIEKLTENLNYG